MVNTVHSRYNAVILPWRTHEGHPIARESITVTLWWARWRLKSPASRLFTQPFIQAQIKEKHQISASLAFVRGPVNCPHKWPVTRKMFPLDDVIMIWVVIRECKVWPKFYHYNCCVVCTIVLYMTVYRINTGDHVKHEIILSQHGLIGLRTQWGRSLMRIFGVSLISCWTNTKTIFFKWQNFQKLLRNKIR